MKLTFKSIAIIFTITIIVLSFTAFKSFGQDSLNINVSNIKKNSGKIIVEIFNSKSSWLKTPYRKLELSTNQDIQTASFQVPYGKYAITVYQDLNVNGEADMNFIGIPKEPVGFGNNYKPFGEPKFESALIEYKATSKLQEIKLYKVF
ncbi:MAG: DUF2141 domain-containing protein [Bacteroidota bacterium]|nr:DUF2141 domain-containing protein [Bacteroidota bacterium]